MCRHFGDDGSVIINSRYSIELGSYITNNFRGILIDGAWWHSASFHCGCQNEVDVRVPLT